MTTKRQEPLATVVYDSRTGNVQRFINRLKNERNWDFVKVEPNLKINKAYHFLTYTTGIGAVPDSTKKFVTNNPNVLTVSSSGNMNWGPYFGIAADKIAKQTGCDILMKFELSGTKHDIDKFIAGVELYGN